MTMSKLLLFWGGQGQTGLGQGYCCSGEVKVTNLIKAEVVVVNLGQDNFNGLFNLKVIQRWI